MGSSDIQWHDIPVFSDLALQFAQSGFYNDVWLPSWDVFAQGVNYIVGAPLLWHR